jgi:hypothetical protein
MIDRSCESVSKFHLINYGIGLDGICIGGLYFVSILARIGQIEIIIYMKLMGNFIFLQIADRRIIVHTDLMYNTGISKIYTELTGVEKTLSSYARVVIPSNNVLNISYSDLRFFVP